MPALDIATAGEPETVPGPTPPPPLKIALIGTAPASRALAPVGDPSWTIWACSPGNQFIPRAERFYEIHDRKTITDLYKDKALDWLKGLGSKLTVAFDIPELPEARKLPIDQIEAMHDAEFLTSTPALMMAEAIALEPQAIGLWGLDMAAEAEYQAQRPGMKHFLELAKFSEIQIVLPPNTPLNHRPLPYPFRHYTPLARWIEGVVTRKTDEMKQFDMAARHSEQERTRLSGYLDAFDQIRKNWT